MSLEEEKIYPCEEACLQHVAYLQKHAYEGDSTSFKDEKNLAGTSPSPNESASTGTGSDGTDPGGIYPFLWDVDAENDAGQNAAPAQTEEVHTQSEKPSLVVKKPVTSPEASLTPEHGSSTTFLLEPS